MRMGLVSIAADAELALSYNARFDALDNDQALADFCSAGER